MNKGIVPQRIATVSLSIVLTLICVSNFNRPTQANATLRTISDLRWMSGSWRTAPGGKVQVEEHWTAPAGGSMLGMGRTVGGGHTIEFEYLRIEQRGTDIYYVAHPQAQCPGTDFKLTSLSGDEVVFENPAHDFPKRIIYRKSFDGSLTATVDGGAGTRSQQFIYHEITTRTR